MEKLRNLVDNDCVKRIIDANVVLRSGRDVLIWQPTNDGRFTSKSAWELIWARGNNCDWKKWLWSSMVPKKLSSVSWRALRSKLPVVINIQAVGVKLASRYNCCMQPSYETADHVLSMGDLAKELWRYFAGACTILFSEASCWQGKWYHGGQKHHNIHRWLCYMESSLCLSLGNCG